MDKRKKNILLGLSTFVIGVVLFVYTGSMTTNAISVAAAQPGAYLRLWLGLFIILSVILTVRALRSPSGEKEERMWGPLQIFTTAIMVFYLMTLKRLGFTLDTFILLMSTATVYNLAAFTEKPDRKMVVKVVLKCLLFSTVVTLATLYLFQGALSVRLPKFSLF